MLAAILLATMFTPSFGETVAGAVRIRVYVRASVYSYQVINEGIGPITRFEVPYSDGYYFQVPEGWKKDVRGGVFRAWTEDDSRAIRPGAYGVFSFRVTSRGAVLGPVAARIERVSGQTVVLPNLWGAVPEPRGNVLLVAGSVLALCALHTWVAARVPPAG